MTAGKAQNYHAIQGSSYAGSLGTGFNPASIVNTPYAWDVTPFAFQVKGTTNVVTIRNYSLLSNPANSEYLFRNGDYARKANLNYNVNLLNARFALNRETAIAFGMNIRGYVRGKTSRYNFIDSLTAMEDFFRMNANNNGMNANVISNHWIELYGTYAQTITDNYRNRLNAGATLKVSRGLAAGHTGLNNISIQPVLNGENVSILTSGSAHYGYSSNIDGWDDEKNASQNIRDFITRTEGGASVDIGVEYLIKPKGFIFFGEDERYYDYDWKIGVSLMDLGFTRYKYSRHSRQVSGLQENVTGELLDQKFSNIEGIENFIDSLATVVRTMRRISGTFTVYNPTRLAINVDRFVYDAFYVNADVSISLVELAGDDRFYAKDINLVTITPRWETRRWGLYMPIQYNTEKKLWVGGAFKAGPLLFGIHNLANLFAKDKMQNGGGYLSLNIRPGRKNEGAREKRNRKNRIYDCP